MIFGYILQKKKSRMGLYIGYVLYRKMFQIKYVDLNEMYSKFSVAYHCYLFN